MIVVEVCEGFAEQLVITILMKGSLSVNISANICNQYLLSVCKICFVHLWWKVFEENVVTEL